MNIALGLVIGLIFGTAVSLLELRVLNQKLKKIKESGEKSNKSLLVMMLLRYLFNPVLLVIIFLLREHFPFDPYALLFGTAFGITIPTHIWAIRLNKKNAE